MARTSLLQALKCGAALAAVVSLVGCTIAKPRTDDPLEKFNRKSYAFNDSLDKAIIRPVAVGYRDITNAPVRRSVDNFYTNIRMPISIANDLLQARPVRAIQGTGRFLLNLTLGIGGFFDPASQLGIPLEQTDFGITLARWGVPEGDYLVLPFVGSTTMRDIWRLPVDSYFFDPLSYYSRNHSFKDGQYYVPQVIYLITLREHALDAESFLNSAFDPYAFLRDAYRQQRLSMLYDGNPPNDVIEQMQGTDNKNFDPDELLKEQHDWERKNGNGPSANSATKPVNN